MSYPSFYCSFTKNNNFDMNLVYVPNITINTVTIAPSGTYPLSPDVKGTAITNGINYDVLTFTNISPTVTSYTINYKAIKPATIYVLAVGGGGGGGSFGGGGGGAGGVVMTPVTIPAGTSSIVINVGAGGNGAAANAGSGSHGSNTTVNFTANSALNIIAGGGSGGCARSTPSYTQYGSGGGGGASGGNCNPTNCNNGYLNFANNGAPSVGTSQGGGGGGAGTYRPIVSGNNGSGGDGIQCFLPGIGDFNPSGTSYKSYYWGGGGCGASSGSGGLGGGGAQGGTPGTNGLNVGTSSNGNAGANTGGGGGGNWTGTAGGNGGSGIVVIAFPSAIITPPTTSMLTNTALSSTAYNNVYGAYACKLVNYNYYGPIFTLRHIADTTGASAKNFYSDESGTNIGDSYLGTGTSLESWLTTNNALSTYVYVTKWYDQGMDFSFNCAVQNTLTSQPIYEIANKLINFGYQGIAPQTNCFFNLPNGAVPYTTYYSVILKHGIVANTTGGGFLGCGSTQSANRENNFRYGGSVIYNYWYSNDYSATITYANNSTISFIASGTSTNPTTTAAAVNSSSTIYTNSYANGNALTATAAATRTGWNCTTDTCVIGRTSLSEYLNGQLYYLYMFSAGLSDTDRLLLESTLSSSVQAFSSTSVTSGWNSAAGDIVSRATGSNGVLYTVYAFKSAPTTFGSATYTSYTLTYTFLTPTYINVLMVGGGGGGGGTTRYVGAGGGGGGVIMKSILVPAGTNQTITINVGAGGSGGNPNTNGSNTSITFNAGGTQALSGGTLTTVTTFTAYGGGAGACSNDSIAATSGGSGGGGGRDTSTVKTGGAGNGNSTGTTSNFNYANAGGNGVSSGGLVCAGGGGAGQVGYDGVTIASTTNNIGRGGDGIKCSLNGISTFSPSSVQYGTYLWAGGGGAGAYSNTTPGANYISGGNGGGGAGSNQGGSPSGNPGTGGITTGSGLNGGVNTGGGGGGSWTATSGNGGSGICLIAIPSTPVTTADA